MAEELPKELRMVESQKLGEKAKEPERAVVRLRSRPDVQVYPCPGGVVEERGVLAHA